jgi:uncharacterized membrane protein YcaP (DUF421 family)
MRYNRRIAMTELWILAGALVACGVYINYLTYKLGRMATHLENANTVLMVMMNEEAENGGEL